MLRGMLYVFFVVVGMTWLDVSGECKVQPSLHSSAVVILNHLLLDKRKVQGPTIIQPRYMDHRSICIVLMFGYNFLLV